MKLRALIATIVVLEFIALGVCTVWYYSPWAGRLIEPIAVLNAPSSEPGASQGVAEFTNATELHGPQADVGATLSRKIDFSREKLVRVDWMDTGPLNARLAWSPRWGGREVVFYVSEPRSSRRTCAAAKMYHDWFTVPLAAEIKFADRRSPQSRDFPWLALVGLTMAGSTMAVGRRWPGAG